MHIFCMWYVLSTVFLQESKLEKRKSYLENSKEEKIYLFYRTVSKTSMCKWTHAVQSHVVQGPTVFIIYFLIKKVFCRKKYTSVVVRCGPSLLGSRPLNMAAWILVVGQLLCALPGHCPLCSPSCPDAGILPTSLNQPPSQHVNKPAEGLPRTLPPTSQPMFALPHKELGDSYPAPSFVRDQATSFMWWIACPDSVLLFTPDLSALLPAGISWHFCYISGSFPVFTCALSLFLYFLHCFGVDQKEESYMSLLMFLSWLGTHRATQQWTQAQEGVSGTGSGASKGTGIRESRVRWGYHG